MVINRTNISRETLDFLFSLESPQANKLPGAYAKNLLPANFLYAAVSRETLDFLILIDGEKEMIPA